MNCLCDHMDQTDSRSPNYPTNLPLGLVMKFAKNLWCLGLYLVMVEHQLVSPWLYFPSISDGVWYEI
jgi:hypothetical protein